MVSFCNQPAAVPTPAPKPKLLPLKRGMTNPGVEACQRALWRALDEAKNLRNGVYGDGTASDVTRLPRALPGQRRRLRRLDRRRALERAHALDGRLRDRARPRLAAGRATRAAGRRPDGAHATHRARPGRLPGRRRQPQQVRRRIRDGPPVVVRDVRHLVRREARLAELRAEPALRVRAVRRRRRQGWPQRPQGDPGRAGQARDAGLLRLAAATASPTTSAWSSRRPSRAPAFHTVEGNTSSGMGGSQSNGDGVYQRTRYVSDVICFASFS